MAESKFPLGNQKSHHTSKASTIVNHRNSNNIKSKKTKKTDNGSTLKILSITASFLIVIATVVVLIYWSSNKSDDSIATDFIIGENLEINEDNAEKITSNLEYKSEKNNISLIFYDKKDLYCLTKEKTLGSLFDELNITLSDNELLDYDLSSNLSSDSVINVDNVSYGTDTGIEYIDYDIEYVDVQTIPRGSTSVYQAGVEGTKTIEYTVTYVNGTEVKREKSNEYITSYPTKCIVYRGVGGTLTIGGQTYNYSYYLDCKSTVYSGSGGTASGLPLNESVIAVDPTVIPFYTQVYVEGVGVRTAADTGTAIKGNFIDIYFNSDNPMYWPYGVRYVKVYILG